MKNINYVCPIAMDWNDICEMLVKEYRATHIPEPKLKGLAYWNHIGLPIPLILGAWNFTSDFEKANRWQETLDWAEKNNLTWVIERAHFRKHGNIVHDNLRYVREGSQENSTDDRPEDIQDDSMHVRGCPQRFTEDELHEIAINRAINYLGKDCIVDVPGLRGEFPDILALLEEFDGRRLSVIQVYPTLLSSAGCDLPDDIEKRLIECSKPLYAQPMYISMGIGTNSVNRMNGGELYKTDALLFHHYGAYFVFDSERPKQGDVNYKDYCWKMTELFIEYRNVDLFYALVPFDSDYLTFETPWELTLEDCGWPVFIMFDELLVKIKDASNTEIRKLILSDAYELQVFRYERDSDGITSRKVKTSRFFPKGQSIRLVTLRNSKCEDRQYIVDLEFSKDDIVTRVTIAEAMGDQY